MLKFSSLALLSLSLTAIAATNPFAPKQTPSTPKSKYMSKLLQNARETSNSQLRRLDEDGAGQMDLTGYSLRFEQCQFVKTFSDQLAQTEGTETVLGVQRFAVFRLCPTSSKCSSCSTGYGEYIIDLADYLDATVEYRTEEQEQMCNTCEEECAYYGYADAGEEEAADGEEEAGGERRLSYTYDCNQCKSDCEKIENMEENFYIDATDFVQCVSLNANDSNGNALYAGPMCTASGSKIKIGVYYDEDCYYLNADADVENYLADENGNSFKLSHALLKTTYDQDSCISCAQKGEVNDDGSYEINNLDLCANIYEAAAKCEQTHGFSGGVATNNYYAGNQAANEELVCDFIYSLKSGTYSQDGEIVIGGKTTFSGASGSSSTTGGQKFALTFFILGTVGLAVYAAMLHSQLTKGGKTSLSSQGGAMA